jgi:hypothetical protein
MRKALINAMWLPLPKTQRGGLFWTVILCFVVSTNYLTDHYAIFFPLFMWLVFGASVSDFIMNNQWEENDSRMTSIVQFILLFLFTIFFFVVPMWFYIFDFRGFY